MGCLPFDLEICKFEWDEWFAACDININGELERKEGSRSFFQVLDFQSMMKLMISEENKAVEALTENGEILRAIQEQ